MRADFQNDTYSLNGASQVFTDLFTQTYGGDANFYDPVTGSIQTAPSGTPVFRGPMGRKGLVLAGLDATIHSGTATGKQVLTYSASAWAGKKVYVAVWGPQASAVISGHCEVTEADNTARTYRPAEIKFTPPSGATSGQITLDVSSGAVYWMVTRYLAIDGAGPTFQDRAYGATETALPALRGKLGRLCAGSDT